MLLGIATLLLGTAYLLASLLYAPATFDFAQPHLEALFGLLPRLAGASLLAYLTSQHHDVWAYHFWMQRTGGRHLWPRNNTSTLVSQVLDSSAFCLDAFIGVYPCGWCRRSCWPPICSRPRWPRWTPRSSIGPPPASRLHCGCTRCRHCGGLSSGLRHGLPLSASAVKTWRPSTTHGSPSAFQREKAGRPVESGLMHTCSSPDRDQPLACLIRLSRLAMPGCRSSPAPPTPATPATPEESTREPASGTCPALPSLSYT